MYGQKEYLLMLINQYGRDWQRLKADMERGLTNGTVSRISNTWGWSDRTYANAVVNCWHRRGI